MKDNLYRAVRRELQYETERNPKSACRYPTYLGEPAEQFVLVRSLPGYHRHRVVTG